METRTIYLVRHGKIAKEDDQRRYIGQIDVPLSDEGRGQARQLAQRFAAADLNGIFASDLARSRETAEIVAAAAGVSVTTRAELREISMGAWEGCTFGDIASRFPEAYRARGEDIVQFAVPGGESFAECYTRILRAFDEILAGSKGTLLIVGHAGVNRLLLCHFLGMPIANLFRIGQDYGCLNVIQCGGTGTQVKLMNGRGRSGRR